MDTPSPAGVSIRPTVYLSPDLAVTTSHVVSRRLAHSRPTGRQAGIVSLVRAV
jgi:hypothetical protein